MRRLLILAALLLASAHAQTSEIGPPEASEPSATLTCQVAAPNWAGLCFVERPLYSLGGFAVTVGVEARAAYSGAVEGHVAGYVTISYATETAYYWLDVRTPKVAPALGTSDVVRLGFSVQVAWP